MRRPQIEILDLTLEETQPVADAKGDGYRQQDADHLWADEDGYRVAEIAHTSRSSLGTAALVVQPRDQAAIAARSYPAGRPERN